MQVFESIVPDDECIPASLSGASSIHRVSLSGTSSIQLLIEHNRIPGSAKGNNGRGHDLLTNEVKVQLLIACRCSSLLFPTTSLFPRRSAGRLLFIECRCSIKPFKSIVRVATRLLFASSIHRVQVFHSAVQVYCSRRRRVYCSRLLFIVRRCSIQPFKSIVRAVDASIVRVFYCSRLLLCVLRLITGSKTSINGRRFLTQ